MLQSKILLYVLVRKICTDKCSRIYKFDSNLIFDVAIAYVDGVSETQIKIASCWVYPFEWKCEVKEFWRDDHRITILKNAYIN